MVRVGEGWLGVGKRDIHGAVGPALVLVTCYKGQDTKSWCCIGALITKHPLNHQ